MGESRAFQKISNFFPPNALNTAVSKSVWTTLWGNLGIEWGQTLQHWGRFSAHFIAVYGDKIITITIIITILSKCFVRYYKVTEMI